MIKKLRVAAIGGALSLAAAAPASAGVIFFDSFEKQDTGSWAVYQSGVGDNGAWTSVGGSGIEIQDQSLGISDAFDGEQYIELDSDNRRGGVAGDTNSTMAANIDFVAGRTYEISFAYKPRTNRADDNGIRLMAAVFDGLNVSGEDVLLEANETTSTLSDWIVYSVIYTAESGVNALAFEAFGRDNSLGGFIDAVKVAEVPLPAALPLFGFGLAGLAAIRRRKRQAA